MEFEYTIKTYSMQQLSEKGIVVDPEKILFMHADQMERARYGTWA